MKAKHLYDIVGLLNKEDVVYIKDTLLYDIKIEIKEGKLFLSKGDIAIVEYEEVE